MSHPLEAGTVRILKSNGATAGTGFLVSRRLAVTCAHVVYAAGGKPGEIIAFKYHHQRDLEAQRAKVLLDGWSTEDDVAILEIIEKPDKRIRPIIMQPSYAMEGRTFQALGYPNDGPVQIRWPQGNISGRVNVKGYANSLLQLQGKEIDKGLSGSAVVDQTTRRVIGMITSFQDINRPATSEQVRFAYAIPIETIWKIYPDLEKELPPLPTRSKLVEGIHALPNGYDFRIQNFLSEYLGTPEQPEPFGGRDHVLQALNDWLDGNNQRLVLAGPAGRGKSALLVHWLDQLLVREDLELIFIPISVRFRTNLASVFLASFAARLAYLHDEQLPADMETFTDGWHRLISTYLTRPLSRNRKLLVVLDGLDEASDWEATSDFIPMNLPANVRIVVSARFLAGEIDAQPWLIRLGWERSATPLTLEPLDVNGVAEVLQHMGITSDSFDHPLDIAAELYRLSKGDPLLVNLYVEDLWSRGQQLSRLQPGDLYAINPGYEGYFNLWWNDQKKLWGKEAPLHEKNVRQIFNLLCSALGGLTKDDILALDVNNELNTYVIEEALGAVKRFVIGVASEHKGKDIGYVLTHPKLRDFFWDKLADIERSKLDSLFITWGERAMQSLTTGQLEPANMPSYLVEYYGAHLERARAPLEKLLPFIDSPYWQQCWFSYEGAYSGFLHDVSRIWQLSRVLDRETVSSGQGTSFLGTQIRCALISSSFTSMATNSHPELVAQLVKHGVWSVTQALARIKLMPEDADRSKSIVELSPYLRQQDAAVLILLTNAITDPKSLAEALLVLTDFEPRLYPRALDAVKQIKDEWIGAILLCNLLKKLPAYLLEEAYAISCNFQKDWDRARVLCALAEREPRFIEDALKAVEQVENPGARVVLMSLHIRTLFPDRFNIVLGSVNQVFDYATRIEVLRMLTEYRPEVFQNLLQAIHELPDDVFKAYTLYALMPAHPQLLDDAISAAAKIQYEDARFVALSRLANKLPQSIFDPLLESARRIREKKMRARILGMLADAQPDLILEAAKTMNRIGDSTERIEAMIRLATDLPEERDKAIERSRQITDPAKRSSFLSTFIPYRPELLDEAVQSSREIQSPRERSQFQSWLLKWQPSLLDECLQSARSIADDKDRFYALYHLAKHRPQLFPEALLSARRISAPSSRAFCMSVLAKEHTEFFPEILEELNRIEPAQVGEFALERLAKLVPIEHADQLAQYAKKLPQDWEAANILCILATRVPTLLPEAVELVQEIKKEDKQIICLCILASLLPPSSVEELMEMIKDLPDIQKIEAYTLLADEKTNLLDTALPLARKIQDDETRAKAFRMIAEKLPFHTILDRLDIGVEIHFDFYARLSLINIREEIVRLPKHKMALFLEDMLLGCSVQPRAATLNNIIEFRQAAKIVNGESTIREIFDAIVDVTRWWP